MALALGYRYFTDDLDTGSGASNFIWDGDRHGLFIGYSWIFWKVLDIKPKRGKKSDGL